jgi:hypothetical protein
MGWIDPARAMFILSGGPHAMMVRKRRLVPMMLPALALLLGSLPATARVSGSYSYTIMHPTYGAIGTWTALVREAGPEVTIATHLAIAVTVLGITMHRETAERMEVWKDGRLASFEGRTDVNGTETLVFGHATRDGFNVSTPQGTATARGPVLLASPFALLFARPGPATVIAPKSGAIQSVTLSKPEEMLLPGDDRPVRHYLVTGPKREEVWVDPAGIPVRFLGQEYGVPIEGILQQAHAQRP